MRSLLGRGWLAAATLAVGTALPAQLTAQSNAPPEFALRAAPQSHQRAEQLRAQANALMPERGKYRRAAELLREAADLTPTEDGARVDDLRLAANLLYFSGSVSEAEGAMAQAAEAALARGDVEQAANSFLDAGWLAALRRGTQDARTFGERALALTASPLLSEDQRDAIRHRIIQGQAARTPAGAASPAGEQ